MNARPDRILILDEDISSRVILEDLLRQAGYQVSSADLSQSVLESARSGMADLLVLKSDVPGFEGGDLISQLKSGPLDSGVRVLVLGARTSQDRARYLDLGADDVYSPQWESTEMLARIRVQLRGKKTEGDLRRRQELAERGEEMSITALKALAVTEQIGREAFYWGRRLKIGSVVVAVMIAAMAGIYFGFFHRANKETREAYAAVARFNRGLSRQEDLMAEVRKINGEMASRAADSPEARKQRLEKQSRELRAKISDAPAQEASVLRGRLNETEGQLRQIESADSIAQGIIKTYSQSVCLIHVSVAIREQSNGRPLRYAGLSPEGEPLIDLKGQPVMTLEGNGPEVRMHSLGSGFLAGEGGRIVTNHHVVEPWWQHEPLGSMKEEGLEPVIVDMEAFFPGSPRAFSCAIERISSDTDLAAVRADLGNFKPQILSFNEPGDSNLSGQSVVLMGYPTGIEAILARTDESVVREIVMASRGELKCILAELAARNLIRPTVTQGHVGDVLKDKIVYDAQTTSGGSGGPLFNQRGRVIGINFGIMRDFGGSNFAIPCRYAQTLMRP